jgi:putative addiction module component (TIGR02574 family)
MPSDTFENIKTEVLALSDAERARLANDLVASLDGPPDAESTMAWNNEICHRIEKVEAGNATLIDSDEVLNRVKAKLTGNG